MTNDPIWTVTYGHHDPCASGHEFTWYSDSTGGGCPPGAKCSRCGITYEEVDPGAKSVIPWPVAVTPEKEAER